MRVLTANIFHRIVGGAERYYFTVQNLLRRNGHAVSSFSTRSDQNEPSDSTEHFVDDVPAPSQTSLWKRMVNIPRYVSFRAARDGMRDLIREFKPDIAHLHTITYRLTPAILDPLRDAGVPIVQTLHGYKPVCPVTSMLSNGRPCEGCGPGKFHQVLLRRCNEGKLSLSLVNYLESTINHRATAKIDRFIAPSQFCADMMLRFGAVEENRLEVLPYCLDQKYVASEQKGDYLLYFGRLSSEKGLPTLLKASTRNPNLPLHVVGAGPLDESLRAQAGRNVTFHGFQKGEALRRWIAGARAVILPSECYEVYPLSVMESFALGRPVIGSNTGGIPELVLPGRTGWLFERGDVDGLAAAMQDAWEDPVSARDMGRAAEVWASETFDPNRHYQKLMRIYEKAA